MTALADNSDTNFKNQPPDLSAVEIRNMSCDHIEKVAFLERECYSNPWGINSFVALLNIDNSINLVALAQNEVAAYAIAGYVLDEADIMNIATSKKYRRMGIADKLLDSLIAQLIEKGVRHIFLEVRESNISAQNLYKKKGFTPVSVRKAYYSHPTEDAIVMKIEV